MEEMSQQAKVDHSLAKWDSRDPWRDVYVATVSCSCLNYAPVFEVEARGLWKGDYFTN
jgi:hypothetical protein